MNILFITDVFPYPLNTGGKIVSYQLLKTLSNKFHIHLLSLVGQQPTVEEYKAITSLGIVISTVLSQKQGELSKYEMIRSILHLKPFFLFNYYEHEFKVKMNKLLESKQFDIVHVDHLYMSQYLPKEKRQYWILSEHNIEYKIQYAFFKKFRIPIKFFFIHAYNAAVTWWYEKQILQRFNQIIVLSENDKQQIITMGTSPKKIFVSPPWQEISPDDIKKKSKELLFVGNIWWPPNFDALKWFMQKIFPIIQKKISGISLKVVGENSALLESFAQNNTSIQLFDRVDNLTPYLKNARIFILPFRIAEGVRIKALTAFAWSLPVISTQKGIQGLLVKTGVHYLKAQTPNEFASQIKKVLDNSELEGFLTKNAKHYVQTYHNATIVQCRLLAAYAQV